MDERYKKLECYTYMPEKERICFDKLVEHYSHFLGEGKTENATATRFTLHDFEHHCYDLFKYISEVILSKVSYGSGGLNSRELYILNLAVLFHDISLHLVEGCDRQKHARQSSEWVQDEYENQNTTFSDVCELAETEVYALCAIIMAHSDEKNGDEKIGLENLELRDYPAKEGVIRVKLVAGILRLADELDISTLRIGDRRFEGQLKKLSEEYEQANNQYCTAVDVEIRNNAEQEMRRLKPSAESYKHWKKLHYFEEVSRSNTAIIIKGNEDRIKREIAQGKEDEVEELIEEVFYKVSKEFLKIQKLLLTSVDGYRAIIAIDKVEIQGIERQLKERLESEYQKLKNEVENEAEKTIEHRALQVEGAENLEEAIGNLIETKNLLAPGHFVMNSKYCACDWIDTQAVLENADIYRECMDLYIRHIKKSNLCDVLLIGLDLQGALMASTIGFMLGVPFAYIIPVHKKDQNSERDSRLNFTNEKSVILFTDAIVTTQSIDDACVAYNIRQNSIKAIYTIFYRPVRKSIKTHILSDKYTDKIYYINDKYIVDLISRDECERNEPEKCLACNKQIDLGGNGI